MPRWRVPAIACIMARDGRPGRVAPDRDREGDGVGEVRAAAVPDRDDRGRPRRRRRDGPPLPRRVRSRLPGGGTRDDAVQLPVHRGRQALAGHRGRPARRMARSVRCRVRRARRPSPCGPAASRSAVGSPPWPRPTMRSTRPVWSSSAIRCTRLGNPSASATSTCTELTRRCFSSRERRTRSHRPSCLGRVVEKLGGRAELVPFEGGGHSFEVRGRKRDPRAVGASLAPHAAAFIRDHG